MIRHKQQRGRSKVIFIAVLGLAGAAALWFWRGGDEAPKAKGPGVVPVTSALIETRDLPVRLAANGTVTPVQSVEVRAQISATVREVHVREGQTVKAGDALFSLDVRTEAANLGKAEAQIAKTGADLANAERNLARQKDLFAQKFISQTALDTVQNQVDSLRAQLAADRAAADASRVARGFGEIRAPIAGRLGAVAVYPGSLVQPSGTPLTSIAQIDPVDVAFTLPERELPMLQAAAKVGAVAVTAKPGGPREQVREGELIFIDNAVDGASGTIRVKARFANQDGRLWPGMFVNVELAPRQLAGALVVPAQAVQIGPEKKFLYVIDAESKVTAVPVRLLLVQDGLAAIEAVKDTLPPDTRVVVEGAQNLRPGSQVSEGKATDAEKKAAPAAKP